ncbi:flavodoxin domain-containing protein [Liquorilactobacillus uvarum]|uniref:flavodoxin domain-containing protein n=1 Tax=Liquorilactobacillus uvarum TaxID=303240 RepID=UPI00070F8957|nr:flavodoxin domain-containing protein [Liquorilactobacillus uvarum]
MNKIVIYSSRYGTSAKYAHKIAEQKNYFLCSLDKIVNYTDKCDEIIFIAPIYIGKIFGFNKLIRELRQSNQVKITLIIVGIYDPQRAENNLKIEKMIIKMVEGSSFKLQSIYRLRGQLNIKKLSITHRILINALYTAAKKKGNEDLSENEKDIISAYENQKQVNDDNFNKMLKNI